MKAKSKPDDKITYSGKSYSVAEFVNLIDLAARVHAMRGTPYYAKAIKILKGKAVKS